MKKVIISLAVIAAVAAVVVGGTTAFFSDTETSTGNTFTAGAIDLTVDSQQHYNGNVCVPAETGAQGYVWEGNAPYPVEGTPCDGTWVLTDLEDGVHKFFNFDDIKPGDWGENTISLHVDSNDAYACVDVKLTKNDDVDCTEPENEAEGDGVCNTDGDPDFDGELAQNVYFTAWADDGDNVWEDGELLLFSNQYGPAIDVLNGVSYTLADSNTGPLVGNQTTYIGLAWCAGTMTVDENSHTIECNGAGMGNEAQTDSMVADITFRIEQARNNPDFVCEFVD